MGLGLGRPGAWATTSASSCGAGLPGLRERPRPAPGPADLQLRAPRVSPPPALAHLCSNDPVDRAAHTHGKAYRDVVRNLLMELDHPPDLVVRPTAEQDVVDVLHWASDQGVAVVPFGGGSSVVGGVEYRGDEHGAAVSLDLTALDAGARGRPRQPGRPDPGGRLRPRAGGRRCANTA